MSEFPTGDTAKSKANDTHSGKATKLTMDDLLTAATEDTSGLFDRPVERPDPEEARSWTPDEKFSSRRPSIEKVASRQPREIREHDDEPPLSPLQDEAWISN